MSHKQNPRDQQEPQAGKVENDHNKLGEHHLVLLQGDRRHAGDSSDGVIARRQLAEVLVASLTSEHALRKTFELVATQGDPDIDAILDNVILMLWPTLNPDGQDEVVSWYRKNLGTPFETSPLPDLYQEYVGHDNNRDG